MRGLDGRLIADLNDSDPANVTGSVATIGKSDYNENLTSYNLLPELINFVPYFEKSAYDASEPVIKPIQFNEEDRDLLYVDENGVIKVTIGSNFVLRCKAQQPPIYNVENGIPTLLTDTIIPSDTGRQDIHQNVRIRQLQQTGSITEQSFLEEDLTYVWFKDNAQIAIDQVDPGRPGAKVSFRDEGTALVFENISQTFTGTYYCEITNDIGTITTEYITLEVYNPDLENTFYTNLVQNSTGEQGIDGWTTADDEFKSAKLSTAPFTEFSKQWNQDTFGYSLDMFYPRPYHINTYDVKNSNFTRDYLTNGSYFTRDKFVYYANGGKQKIRAEYDIDLSEIKPYIQGSVYGVNGVRGVFGCYIGNAVNKFRQTFITAINEQRNYIYTIDPSSPRLSTLNALIAGVPQLEESVVVRVTEYDQETPLKTARLVDINTGEVYMDYGITVYDPWTTILPQIGDVNLVPQQLGSGFQSYGNTREEKIIAAVSKLYGEKATIPTHGQYVKWNREVISKLNFKTNKIRISVEFEIRTGTPLEEAFYKFLDTTDSVYENFNWESIVKPFWFPQSEDAYFKIAGNRVGIIDWNETQTIGTLDEIDKPPLNEYTPVYGQPRSLASGFNMVLLPIESYYPNKVNYYTKTILSQVTENLSYPILSSSLLETAENYTELISQWAEYSSSIIGIEVANAYNTPKQIKSQNNQYYVSTDSDTYKQLVNLRAQGGIATATTITTFKFINDRNPLIKTPVTDLTRISESEGASNWIEVAPYRELTTTGSIAPYVGDPKPGSNDYIPPFEKVYVVYNKYAESLNEASIPQIVGELKSNTIKWIDKPIFTSLPKGFEVVETNLNQLAENISFDLQVQYSPYGEEVPPQPSFNPFSNSSVIAFANRPTPYDYWKVEQVGLNQQEAPIIDIECNPFKQGANVNQNGRGSANEVANRQVLYYSLDAEQNSPYRDADNEFYRIGSNYDPTTDKYVPTPIGDDISSPQWHRNVGPELATKLSNQGSNELTDEALRQKSSIEKVLLYEQVSTYTGDQIGRFQIPYNVGDQGRVVVYQRAIDIVNIANNPTPDRPSTGVGAFLQGGFSGVASYLSNPVSNETKALNRRIQLINEVYNKAKAKLDADYGPSGLFGLWQNKYPIAVTNIDNVGSGVTIEIFYKDVTLIAGDDARVITDVDKVVITKKIYAYGGTFDRVKLINVMPKKDMRTPAAIVYPNQKKICYFVYSYIDNYQGEE